MPHAQLDGRIDHADRTVIAGWAADPARPGEPVLLELLLDGVALGRFRADRHRADLEQAGLGRGHHAFQIRIPDGLSLHADRVLILRSATTGVALAGSPVVLRRAVLNQEEARRAILDSVQAAALTAPPDAVEALLRQLARRVASEVPDPAPHHRALLERWAELASDAAPDPAIAARPRALIIDEALPDPSRDAGSSALLSHLRALQRHGFAAEFVPAWSPEVSEAAAAGLAALGVQVWTAPWIGSVEEVLRRGGDGYRLVYVHRLGVMQKYAALIRRWCPAARLIYCVADLHHLRAARQAAAEAGETVPIHPQFTTPDLMALRALELAAIGAADATLTHSPFEAGLLASAAPDAPVHVVPWAVAPRAQAAPSAARRGVGFIGSFGHPPNRDAAWRLLDEVMPVVWEAAPDLPCLLAGSDLPADLRAAAAAAAGPAEALGAIADIDTLWSRVLLSAAPLGFGAGIKGKVLDSLAAGIPCVMSPIAAEGLDLPPQLDGLVGTTAAELAAIILRLHADPAELDRLAGAGRAYIAARNSQAVVDAALRPALALPPPARPVPLVDAEGTLMEPDQAADRAIDPISRRNAAEAESAALGPVWDNRTSPGGPDYR